ncbi:MAG: hypothetical protein IMZ65_00060 [Planctomycetes bacterium]|nr:hypothetical protein [Planctomycetota bacterium]
MSLPEAPAPGAPPAPGLDDHGTGASSRDAEVSTIGRRARRGTVILVLRTALV